ncbi:MAG: tetratricopeptide repeat protein [Chloroflexi bacterium]|nr:MAG: tetratricopeptide repeat protein [Chloroflexota bacterium]
MGLGQRLGLTRYDADEHYKKALVLYQARELDKAIIEIGYAIELLPGNAEYYAARGFFFLEDGIDKEAKQNFEQALERYPYEMLAHYGLGMLAYKAKKWQEAITHFTQAYHADPERAETLYYLALAYHHDMKNALALSYMQQAASRFDDQQRKRNAEKWIKELQQFQE